MHFIVADAKCHGTMQEAVNAQFSQSTLYTGARGIFLDLISYRIKTNLAQQLNSSSQATHDLVFHAYFVPLAPYSSATLNA